MDIQTPLIFVGIFSIACLLLVFIYKFGIKEKSYEEALAEQRQQTHILLGVKPKPKDKKSKKVSKKNKKEIEGADDNEVAESVNSDTSEGHKKPHVEFNEVPEEVLVTKNANVSKKQSKKEKVRSILVHKEKPENIKAEATAEPATSNHFLDAHPKDEFELLRSNSGENLTKLEPAVGNGNKQAEKASGKVKLPKPEPEVPTGKVKVPKTEPEALKEVKKQPETVPVAVISNGSQQPGVGGVAVGNTGKEKKKKKSEFNTLQQLAGDVNGPNMSVLLNSVRKAELSRSEVQILIDLLLNKQHEAPEIIDEWSEGKFDPVQKLKKQLAEKEMLLSEEQQVASNAQTKLREIRGEFQAEKSQLQQKIRSYEEMYQAKQMEGARVHQQLQQLQAQLKDEMVKNHKLREEQAAIQMQRQQFDMRLAKLQESEVIINQLQGEAQEMAQLNNHLRIECARLTEENVAEKERQQGFIIQLNNFQKELEQKNERNQMLEESRLDIEHALEKSLNQETDFKSQLSHLNTTLQQKCEELRRLEHSRKQSYDELQKNKDESNKLIAQLRNELQKLQEEKSSHVNGVTQENKQHEVKILNLQNELSSLKNQLGQAEKKLKEELKVADGTIERLKAELEEERNKLEEQKSKNNELRTKNWKVMEALNAAESRIKTSLSTNKVKSEQDVQKEFIQRLFPDIKELGSIKPDVFQHESEELIKNYVNGLKQQTPPETDDSKEVKALKSQVLHYTGVIDSTEKMLNNLQAHVEQEEIKWRMLLAAKTAELDALKESQGLQLQEKLGELGN